MSSLCSTHREKRNAYRILMRTSEGKRPLGTGLREIGWCVVDCDLTEDRDQWRAIVNTVMKVHLPIKYWKFLE
jgi:hypothetical protein